MHLYSKNTLFKIFAAILFSITSIVNAAGVAQKALDSNPEAGYLNERILTAMGSEGNPDFQNKIFKSWIAMPSQSNIKNPTEVTFVELPGKAGAGSVQLAVFANVELVGIKRRMTALINVLPNGKFARAATPAFYDILTPEQIASRKKATELKEKEDALKAATLTAAIKFISDSWKDIPYDGDGLVVELDRKFLDTIDYPLSNALVVRIASRPCATQGYKAKIGSSTGEIPGIRFADLGLLAEHLEKFVNWSQTAKTKNVTNFRKPLLGKDSGKKIMPIGRDSFNGLDLIFAVDEAGKCFLIWDETNMGPGDDGRDEMRIYMAQDEQQAAHMANTIKDIVKESTVRFDALLADFQKSSKENNNKGDLFK